MSKRQVVPGDQKSLFEQPSKRKTKDMKINAAQITFGVDDGDSGKRNERWVLGVINAG